MPKSALIEGHARCAMASIKNEKNNGQQNEETKCASINTYSDVISMCIVLERVKRKDSINEVQT